ncbi:MAG: hypothetical protein ACPGTU_06610 [Myxococcota bacterium]
MNSFVAMMLWIAASLGIPGFECDPDSTYQCETSEATQEGASGPPPTSQDARKYSQVFRIYNGF